MAHTLLSLIRKAMPFKQISENYINNENLFEHYGEILRNRGELI
jgi:hypothetical protein